MGESLTVTDRHIDDYFNPDQTEIYDLNLQVSVNSVAYSLYDTEKERYIGVESFHDPLARVLDEVFWLKKPFHSVTCMIENNKFSLIPSLLFEPGHEKDFLDFSVERESDEVILSDHIHHMDIRNLYSVNGSLLNLIRTTFPSPKICHITTALIRSIGLHYSDRSGETQLFVHIRKDAVDIILFEKRQLFYCNSFLIRAPEDLVYYVMFVMEQLGLNPEETGVVLMGAIDRKSAFTDLLSMYICRVDFARHSEAFKYSYALEEIPGHHYYPLLNPGPCES
ncbi:MAG: DUF3822 family protein [Bacteroidota bacterium]|nr:DUF3822 family protein [Bacteroidota bacterium]